MTERWFRFYDGVPDDPKVLKLSDKHFRAWALLLCIANRYGGEIAKDLEDAALIMRATVAKLQVLMMEMIRLELFEETETGYAPHNWNGRQYKSDVSTGRVKEFRERQRNVSCAVSETPPEDRVQKTETETEKKKEISVVPTSRPPKNALNGHKADFTEFYSAFPRHVAPRAAEKAYAKALSRASPQIILAGAKRYASANAREDPKYIQHPATWLNADRWLDEDGKTSTPLDPVKAVEVQDRADQIMRRGKYAEGSA